MKSAAFLAIGIAVLAALFFAFKPATPAPAPVPAAPAAGTIPPPIPTPVAPVASARASGPIAIDIEVSKGKLVKGPDVTTVREGEEITVNITSDAADEMHLHGYDRHAHLKPGVTATLKFKATKTGRFTYELHNAGLELGAIEVHPR